MAEYSVLRKIDQPILVRIVRKLKTEYDGTGFYEIDRIFFSDGTERGVSTHLYLSDIVEFEDDQTAFLWFKLY